MSTYLKAIVAAIITGVGSIVAVIQAAITDDEITNAEWQLIVTAIVTAVIAVVGVYAARNTPAPES